MKRNIFISKGNYKLNYLIFLIILSIILLYLLSIYIINNKKNFIIYNNENTKYYFIPEDKEGERVKFINKKSINNLLNLKEKNKNFVDMDINFTIQLFSDIDYEKVNNFYKNLSDTKSEIISKDHLYIFSINSEIGTDYFLTYKNFNSKIEAMKYCKKLSFVKKCLVLNAQIINF